MILSATQVIYCSHEQAEFLRLNQLENVLIFPETGLLFEDIRNLPRYEGKTVLTTSPMLCTNYKEGEVYYVSGHDIEPLLVNIYGCCFTIASKALNVNTKSFLSESVIKEIREHIAISSDTGLQFIESLGNSMEKAYLLKALSKGHTA